MDLDILSLILGLAGGALLAGASLGMLLIRAERQVAETQKDLAFERNARTEMHNAFSLVAQDALNKNSEQFLQRFSELAQEKMKQAQNNSAHDLEKRQLAINEIVAPMKKQLEALGNAVEQIKGTDMELRKDLQSLGRETARLVGALKDPAAQGRWGEFILEGLLDKSGLIKGVHYETQVTIAGDQGRQRPDAVIHLHDGLHIIVDAKAPLNEFADRLGETTTPEEMKGLMDNLAAQIRKHIRALGQKNYWDGSIESADFTVLFLPSEHLFSAALQADPSLVDLAARNDIIIASPTLMMSLLRVVGMGWRQVDLAKNAQEISQCGADLYKRLAAFGTHLEKAGKGIAGAMDGYNAAIGSLERSVMPAARKLRDLQGSTGQPEKDIPPLQQLDDTPRRLSSNDFTNDDPDDLDDTPDTKKQAKSARA